MAEFRYNFTVAAPQQAVADFHYGPDAFKKLSPPPIYAQIHRFPPVNDGSVAEFTLWFGPLPLRWRAVHSDVSAAGFTDTQEAGPLRSWVHTHRFTAVAPDRTRISEHIVYEHHSGWRGLLTRLLFNPVGLRGLFTARKWLTRWHMRGARPTTAQSA